MQISLVGIPDSYFLRLLKSVFPRIVFFHFDGLKVRFPLNLQTVIEIGTLTEPGGVCKLTAPKQGYFLILSPNPFPKIVSKMYLK